MNPVVIILWIICGIVCAIIHKNKGYSPFTGFVGIFIFCNWTNGSIIRER